MVKSEKRFQIQAKEEIRILRMLNKQDTADKANIVVMLNNFMFRNHVCIVFEMLGLNLYELILRNKFRGFKLTLVRKIAGAILSCLELLNQNGLIHCDLKPENILIRNSGKNQIKVIDFGSSCFEHQKVYTYIQSRFYRAPEVILGGR